MQGLFPGGASSSGGGTSSSGGGVLPSTHEILRLFWKIFDKKGLEILPGGVCTSCTATLDPSPSISLPSSLPACLSPSLSLCFSQSVSLSVWYFLPFLI